MSLSWPFRCHGPYAAALGLRLYPKLCSSPEASTRGLASSSGCVPFYLPWAWGSAAILRARRQAPAASPQVACASGRRPTTPVWASTLSSLGFIVQACIAVILCAGLAQPVGLLARRGVRRLAHKSPVLNRDRARIRSNDPTSFSTPAEAREDAQAKAYDGISLVFIDSNPLCDVDFPSCVVGSETHQGVTSGGRGSGFSDGRPEPLR